MGFSLQLQLGVIVPAQESACVMRDIQAACVKRPQLYQEL